MDYAFRKPVWTHDQHRAKHRICPIFFEATCLGQPLPLWPGQAWQRRLGWLVSWGSVPAGTLWALPPLDKLESASKRKEIVSWSSRTQVWEKWSGAEGSNFFSISCIFCTAFRVLIDCINCAHFPGQIGLYTEKVITWACFILIRRSKQEPPWGHKRLSEKTLWFKMRAIISVW